MTLEVPYQIDYTHAITGRNVKQTKRRVRFVFGFANQDMVNTGALQGPDARGDEHEVIIVWSWTSGKQEVLLNGEHVYRGYQKEGLLSSVLLPDVGNFFFSFYLNNHILTLKGKAISGDFDLEIDGQSFFDLLKIYQLGTQDTSYPPRRISSMPSLQNFSENQIVQSQRNTYDTLSYADDSEIPSSTDFEVGDKIVEKKSDEDEKVSSWKALLFDSDNNENGNNYSKSPIPSAPPLSPSYNTYPRYNKSNSTDVKNINNNNTNGFTGLYYSQPSAPPVAQFDPYKSDYHR